MSNGLDPDQETQDQIDFFKIVLIGILLGC